MHYIRLQLTFYITRGNRKYVNEIIHSSLIMVTADFKMKLLTNVLFHWKL